MMQEAKSILILTREDQGYLIILNLGKGVFWGVLVSFVCKFCLI